MGKRKKVVLNSKNHLYLFLASFLTVLLSLLAFNLFFLNRIFLNVYIGSRSYSAVAKSDVINRLNEDLRDHKIVFVVGEKTIETNLGDIGITFDKPATFQSLFAYGRSDSMPKDLLTRTSTFLPKRVQVKPIYTIDFDKFNFATNKFFGSLEKKADNAKIIARGGEFSIVSAKNGQVVDRHSLVEDIKAHVNSLSDEPVSVKLSQDRPTIEDAQVQQALEKLKIISKQKIVLTFGYDKWSLSGANLLELLNLDKWEKLEQSELDLAFFDSAVVLSNINLSDRGQTALDVNFDEEKIDKFVSDIAKSVNRPSKDATLMFDGGKIVEFSAAVDGQQLDNKLLKKQILSKISASETKDSQISIEVPVTITKAKIANREVNSLGIKELVGRGVSYFAGSIPNRVFNIGLGSKLVSGTVVKPGEIFSFNSVVGPVSAEQGFKQAYVINKGRTVLDDGGGICQVSTTVFRAVLNAGLPIVKRTAHAYRVAYYEQHGFKPGIDATIFSPSVDFQFKNDTANHLLVQAVVDSTNAKLQVDIFGTSDGRQVELGEVSVTNVKPAPDPLYQDEPTLPTGTVKQVDFAAAGATTVFSRKVYRGSELLIDESFKSNFRPWQAVYLVGKG